VSAKAEWFHSSAASSASIVYRVIESRIEIPVVAVGRRRDVYERLKKMLEAR